MSRASFIRKLTGLSAGLLTVLATAGGGVVLNTTTAAAAPPTPPFTQCPKVGWDLSCAVLLVINADGSVTTVFDATQGPFDGVEDTLIGIQNNSTSTVSSVNLVSPGPPPGFGFDGDGLCSGIMSGPSSTVGNSGPGTFFPPPAGCPFGPTGYEGKDTSFSNISLLADSGTVNFRAGGLKSGDSAYWSLEGKISAATPFFVPVATTLVVTPATQSATVGAKVCVDATVRDQFGNPMPGIVVNFTVTSPERPALAPIVTGSVTTNSSGVAEFCWTGPPLPGADNVLAQAQSGVRPTGTGVVTYGLPTSTALCNADITQGGWMIANDGNKVTFGGTAFTDNNSAPSGQEQYTDSPASLDVHSINVLALVCTTELADIYGTATVNGSGSRFFRIEVTDPDSIPGAPDTYWIILDTGYDSGSHPLGGGNVELHKT
jgi:hypothetical protein